MKLITVREPKDKEGYWSIFFGVGSPRKRKDVGTIYQWLESRLLKETPASSGRDKTAVRVVYSNLLINETCDSKNPYYLLWATACFLESNLSRETFELKRKLYKEKGMEP